jgi:hypothetical protein
VATAPPPIFSPPSIGAADSSASSPVAYFAPPPPGVAGPPPAGPPGYNPFSVAAYSAPPPPVIVSAPNNLAFLVPHSSMGQLPYQSSGAVPRAPGVLPPANAPAPVSGPIEVFDPSTDVSIVASSTSNAIL